MADPQRSSPITGGWYARYVLAILFLVLVFNVVDRQILSILAEYIKADLGVSDAQLGFLYGTAFAVFYSVFGIPLGRLADSWHRSRLIAIGLAFWSVMTMACGMAGSFMQLAAARLGVGAGEASANPAAHSILSDYFPKERRGTVLAVYASGIFVGSGLGVLIGGLVVKAWNAAYADGHAPLGLAGWQAAFLAVGLPGLLYALWVATLKEPRRGQSEGIYSAQETMPVLRLLLAELATIFPPFPLFLLLRDRRWRPLAINLLALAVVTLTAIALTVLVGNPEQWVALAIGAYAVFSWVQSLSWRDRPVFGMLFHSRAYVGVTIANGLLQFTGFGIAFWAIPFFLRVHEIDVARAGAMLGALLGLGGFLGTNLGGLISDFWRRRTHNGRLYTMLLSAVLTAPLLIGMTSSQNVATGSALFFLVTMASAAGVAPAISTAQDLMLPRMRATASAVLLLLVTFVGLSLGPYTVGRLSDQFGDIGLALQLALFANLFAVVAILISCRFLAAEEDTRVDRAEHYGERVLVRE